MILEQEYIVACNDCGFKRVSNNLEDLSNARDNHKNKYPTHTFDWFSRVKTLTRIEGL